MFCQNTLKIQAAIAAKREEVFKRNLPEAQETLELLNLQLEVAEEYGDVDMINTTIGLITKTLREMVPVPRAVNEDAVMVKGLLNEVINKIAPKEEVKPAVTVSKPHSLGEELGELRELFGLANAEVKLFSEIDQLKLENESLKRHLANNGAKPVHGRQPLDPKQQHLETSINDVLQPDVVSATVAALAPMLAELVYKAVQTQMAVLNLAEAESEVEVELKEALDRLDQVELTAKEVTPVEKPKPKPVHQKPVPTPDDLEPEQAKTRGK